MELGEDESRKEDPGRQKWEQTRIVTALTAYDKLSALTAGGGTEKTAETDARVEGYKQSLLSAGGREKLEAEVQREEAEAQAVAEAQAGPAPGGQVL